MFRPAKRLENIKPSGIRRFSSMAKKIPDVIDLTIGEPDFPVSSQALEAGWNAAKGGKTHYGPTNGLPELREALAKKAFREYGLKYDPETEILVTVGGTEAVFSCLCGLVNPGDQVLIPDPGFVCYEPSVFLTGGVPVHIPQDEGKGFKPRIDEFESFITKKSRVMILNYPSNPTGAVLTGNETAALTKVAEENDLIVVSDEVYEKIVYDDTKHHCIATFPGMKEHTLVVGSFSKTYAMTGLRVGYVYGPKELMSHVWLAHQYVAAPANTIAQHVAVAALEGNQDLLKQMVVELNRRRQLVHKRINQIAGLSTVLPKGAFYFFPNVKRYQRSSEEFAWTLLQEAKVAVVPGSVFGPNGEGHVRISYSTAYEQIEEGLNRIERLARQLL